MSAVTPYYGDGRRVLIATVNDRDDITSVVPPFVFENATLNPSLIDGGIMDTINGHYGQEFLQAALEEAWRVGMRPKNWRLETTEQVAAMDNHLQDMRRLVFNQLPPLTNEAIMAAFRKD